MDKNYVIPLIFLGCCILISQLFIGPEKDIKITFYLIMFLLYLSIYNIYTSVNYYIKLRNYKGLRGDRGEPGDRGIKGSDGTCIMSKGCGILNCKKLILEELILKFPELADINKKVENNILLNPKEKRQFDIVSNYIDILLPQCNNYEEGVDKFRKLIAKTITK